MIKDIARLKKERKAIIVAHNYQPPEIQEIADFVGDSLELSRKAAETSARVIVFCGVHFMAETASLFSPHKIVLLPDLEAGCPMADTITGEDLKREKERLAHPIVVCYVNSTAQVKAESHICCTSSNAVNVVRSLDGEEILFVPDRYLGRYVASITGKRIHLCPRFCPIHADIKPHHIMEKKERFPRAQVLVHPECTPEVIELAHKVLSTGGMIKYVKESPAKEFIIGTEVGIIHRMKRENPEKVFIPACEDALCPNMKKITLEKVLHSLEALSPRINVPEEVRLKAKNAVDRMLAL